MTLERLDSYNSIVSKGKSTFSKLLRLCFTNCVCPLQERNKRIFQNSKCNASMVVEHTVGIIKNKMSYFTSISGLNENILSNWNLRL